MAFSRLPAWVASQGYISGGNHSRLVNLSDFHRMRADLIGAGSAVRDVSSRFRQLLSHQAVQQIDRLERTNHDLEMRDAAIRVEGDDVDAVDLDAVDLVLELQHRA